MDLAKILQGFNNMVCSTISLTVLCIWIIYYSLEISTIMHQQVVAMIRGHHRFNYSLSESSH